MSLISIWCYYLRELTPLLYSVAHPFFITFFYSSVELYSLVTEEHLWEPFVRNSYYWAAKPPEIKCRTSGYWWQVLCAIKTQQWLMSWHWSTAAFKYCYESMSISHLFVLLGKVHIELINRFVMSTFELIATVLVIVKLYYVRSLFFVLYSALH